MLQKGWIISLVTVPSPSPFVYLQEVYPIKQLPQTLYKTSRCYDRQLGRGVGGLSFSWNEE